MSGRKLRTLSIVIALTGLITIVTPTSNAQTSEASPNVAQACDISFEQNSSSWRAARYLYALLPQLQGIAAFQSRSFEHNTRELLATLIAEHQRGEIAKIREDIAIFEREILASSGMQQADEDRTEQAVETTGDAFLLHVESAKLRFLLDLIGPFLGDQLSGIAEAPKQDSASRQAIQDDAQQAIENALRDLQAFEQNKALSRLIIDAVGHSSVMPTLIEAGEEQELDPSFIQQCKENVKTLRNNNDLGDFDLFRAIGIDEERLTEVYCQLAAIDLQQPRIPSSEEALAEEFDIDDWLSSVRNQRSRLAAETREIADHLSDLVEPIRGLQYCERDLQQAASEVLEWIGRQRAVALRRSAGDESEPYLIAEIGDPEAPFDQTDEELARYRMVNAALVLVVPQPAADDNEAGEAEHVARTESYRYPLGHIMSGIRQYEDSDRQGGSLYSPPGGMLVAEQDTEQLRAFKRALGLPRLVLDSGLFEYVVRGQPRSDALSVRLRVNLDLPRPYAARTTCDLVLFGTPAGGECSVSVGSGPQALEQAARDWVQALQNEFISKLKVRLAEWLPAREGSFKLISRGDWYNEKYLINLEFLPDLPLVQHADAALQARLVVRNGDIRLEFLSDLAGATLVDTIRKSLHDQYVEPLRKQYAEEVATLAGEAAMVDQAMAGLLRLEDVQLVDLGPNMAITGQIVIGSGKSNGGTFRLSRQGLQVNEDAIRELFEPLLLEAIAAAKERLERALVAEANRHLEDWLTQHGGQTRTAFGVPGARLIRQPDAAEPFVFCVAFEARGLFLRTLRLTEVTIEDGDLRSPRVDFSKAKLVRSSCESDAEATIAALLAEVFDLDAAHLRLAQQVWRDDGLSVDVSMDFPALGTIPVGTVQLGWNSPPAIRNSHLKPAIERWIKETLGKHGTIGDRGGSVCLNRLAASISGSSAGVRPLREAAC